jgi:hypothetical protein
MNTAFATAIISSVPAARPLIGAVWEVPTNRPPIARAPRVLAHWSRSTHAIDLLSNAPLRSIGFHRFVGHFVEKNRP